MRFVCDSCSAQYMISDDKVGAKGVKVRCKKCGYVILVRREPVIASQAEAPMRPTASNGAGAHDEEPTRPGHGSSSAAKGILEGIADDEIGAAFDQALSSPSDTAARSSDEAPQSVPSIDRHGLSQEAGAGIQNLLKAAAQSHAQPDQAPSPDAVPGENDPAYDWFVAIDEKQVGPLALDKLKDRWDRGEIGPDSLCWRAGLSDWIPLSDVPELATWLAPKPKPVIVAAAPVVSAAPQSNAPIESAFSAGSPSKSGRVVAPGAGGGAQPAVDGPGGWKPSGASALASLMKEEIEALAMPAPPAKRADEPPPGSALLDVPAPLANGRQGSQASAKAIAEDGADRSRPSTQNPYPSLYSYSVSTPSRRGWIIGLSVSGGLLLLALAVVTTILVLRSAPPEPGPTSEEKSKGPSKSESAAAVSSADRQRPASGTPGQSTPAQVPAPGAASGNAATTPSGVKPEEARAEAPAGQSDASAARAEASTGTTSRTERRRERIRPPRIASNEEITVPKRVERGEAVARPAPSSSDDEFDREFGGADKRKSYVPKSVQPSKPTSVYVPPAPGGDVPESLGTGDIMQIVLANKPAIKKCVDEQKKRDSSLSGKIVMTWTILATGRTTNISCASDDFKSSYMAQCMSGLIKTWTFPRHKVQGEPINFPFTF